MSEVFLQSRVEPLHFSEFSVEYEIDILRDDLIHPLVSGNKWRKLKYIVKEILKEGKTVLATFGGAYSNHLVATSFAGKHFGIKTFAFVRGDEERPNNAFENTCIENGMQLIRVSRSQYKNKEKLFIDHFGKNPEIEMVGEGGRHPNALKGCEEIISELPRLYDFIFLSVGTGTTMEGLVKAVSEQELNTRIVGVSSLKNNIELDEIMHKYPNKYWQIEHGFHRGKYASNDEELIAFIKVFKLETGINLEFVYTGKMMIALVEILNSGMIQKGSRILTIHTGGLPQLI